jgi:NAD(P)H-hydrate epimerase
MEFITKNQIILPKRKNIKGQNGRVLVIGGSKEYVGCVALAGIAALRAGADWVTVAAPENVAWAINALSADLITVKCDGGYFSKKHAAQIVKLSQKFDAVLIGNGLTTKKETCAFVQSIIKRIRKPLVIDADAIKVLKIQDVTNAIFTPHQKEFEMLLKNSNLNLENIQKNIGNNVILLKGVIDNIITKDRIYYNKTGNPGMTKAGTGDVLAGLCVGFLAQNKDLLQSAINAAYINGLAGDNLKKKKWYSYIASDLLYELREMI